MTTAGRANQESPSIHIYGRHLPPSCTFTVGGELWWVSYGERVMVSHDGWRVSSEWPRPVLPVWIFFFPASSPALLRAHVRTSNTRSIPTSAPRNHHAMARWSPLFLGISLPVSLLLSIEALCSPGWTTSYVTSHVSHVGRRWLTF